MNSHGGEKKAEVDLGKSKKRKLSIMEEMSSKLGLPCDSTKSPDETETKTIDRLPNFNLPSELLVKSIDMVPISQWASLEFVSHQFQDVIYGLWGKLRQIRLDELDNNEVRRKAEPCQVAEAVLEKFLIRAPNVTFISGFQEFFNRSTSIRLETIQLLSKFQHLQTIDFSGNSNDFSDKWVVTSEIFEVFLESAASRQSWKSLDIVGGIFGTIKSQNDIGNKKHPALNLECFKFNNMETLSIFDRFLPIQWSGLRKLIVVENCGSAKELLSIIRQCNQLINLDIIVPKCGNENGEPSYDDFMRVLVDLENLSILKIGGYSLWLNSPLLNALLVLIQHLARRPITELALATSYCYCTDEIVSAIIDHLPRLKSLELHVDEFKSASFLRLTNEMRELESLKLVSRLSSMVDGTIARAIVANMRQLQCLDLYNTVVDSEGLKCLGDLRNLKDLRITGRLMLGMDSENIENWAHLGIGECLEVLELQLEYDISQGIMGAFLKNMPRLRSMKLTGATDDILKARAVSCPNLIELKLLESPSITSTGIQSVIDHCTRLKILNVFFSEKWFPSALTVGKYRKITFDQD